MTYKFSDIKHAYEGLCAYGAHLVHSAGERLANEDKLEILLWIDDQLGEFRESFPTLKPVFSKIGKQYSMEREELHRRFNPN